MVEPGTSGIGFCLLHRHVHASNDAICREFSGRPPCRRRDSNPRHADYDSGCPNRLSPVNTGDLRPPRAIWTGMWTGLPWPLHVLVCEMPAAVSRGRSDTTLELSSRCRRCPTNRSVPNPITSSESKPSRCRVMPDAVTAAALLLFARPAVGVSKGLSSTGTCFAAKVGRTRQTCIGEIARKSAICKLKTRRWRKPGTLRRSYDVGVFPLMSARRGRALRALLSCKARLRALVTDFRIARRMQQRRVGVSA
jgi:hypothetical protein